MEMRPGLPVQYADKSVQFRISICTPYSVQFWVCKCGLPIRSKGVASISRPPKRVKGKGGLLNTAPAACERQILCYTVFQVFGIAQQSALT
eukprot:9217727-Pyramimonas_sp.AAC.1